MKTTFSLSKIMTVARHELVSTLQRRAVLFSMFGLPLISLLILTGINALASSASADPAGGGAAGMLAGLALDGSNETEIETEQTAIGLVDEAGVVEVLPAGFESIFLLYDDLSAAAAAYAAGAIARYYRVPVDYLTTGIVDAYAKDEFEAESAGAAAVLEILAYNLLARDDVLVGRMLNPVDLAQVDLSEADAGLGTDPDDFFGGFALGIGVAILFFITSMGSAGYLMQNLGQEKANRVLEMLLVSARPFELLAGKLLGLGVIGLIQVLVWGGLAAAVFNRGGAERSASAVPAAGAFLGNLALPAIPASVWVLVGLHFLIGFLVYASLFAGLGALAPSPKESGQYTFFIMLPVFIPTWFASILLQTPDSGWAVALSLFPLTSPVAMPMRLVVSDVPAWQWLLSLGLGALGALVITALIARIFRAQTMLSGQSLTPKRIWQALR